MSKKQKLFKVHKSTKRLLREMIADLPAIPYFIPDPNNPDGEPVAKELKKYVDRKGSDILKDIPDAKINGEPIDPEKMYLQPMVKLALQDHLVSITAAFRKYGDEGAQKYCDQVWDFHYSLKTLPKAPAELKLSEEVK